MSSAMPLIKGSWGKSPIINRNFVQLHLPCKRTKKKASMSFTMERSVKKKDVNKGRTENKEDRSKPLEATGSYSQYM